MREFHTGRIYKNLKTGNRVVLKSVDTIQNRVTIHPVRRPKSGTSITMERFYEFYRLGE